MKKVKFLKDHKHFDVKQGETKELEEYTAAVLVGAGYAEEVDAKPAKKDESKA